MNENMIPKSVPHTYGCLIAMKAGNTRHTYCINYADRRGEIEEKHGPKSELRPNIESFGLRNEI
jgi:sulfur relay (sulfurtransferase) complex TusBCD TusD component (DsrE family)